MRALITISLCMIVKNEESVLERCLQSAAGIADEIIVVDTGSTDATKDIAGRYTDKIFDFVWRDDFSAARNDAFSRATMEYCLWLDADDVLLEADRQAFLQLKGELAPDTDVVMMRYHAAQDANGAPTFSFYRERLLKNNGRFLWAGKVHEAITPAGKILYSQIAVTHRKIGTGDSDRNLRIYRGQIARGETLSPRDQFYYARELYYHQQYAEARNVLAAFLGQRKGWIENNIEACRILAYCYYRMGNEDSALEALLHTLQYAPPRAEVCCEIGGHFLERRGYAAAVFWYELALTRERDDAGGGFISDECYGYLPCIQLCVCYDRLGDHTAAARFNAMAGQYKPNDPAYLQNLAYFNGLGL